MKSHTYWDPCAIQHCLFCMSALAAKLESEQKIYHIVCASFIVQKPLLWHLANNTQSMYSWNMTIVILAKSISSSMKLLYALRLRWMHIARSYACLITLMSFPKRSRNVEHLVLASLIAFKPHESEQKVFYYKLKQEPNWLIQLGATP